MRIIELQPNTECPDSYREQVHRLLFQEWPNAVENSHASWPTEPLNWNPVTILFINKLRNVVGLVIVQSTNYKEREIIYKVSGIGSMIISKEIRGIGYGKKLFRRADKVIGRNGNDFGVFTCDEKLVPFYTAYGWKSYEKVELIGGTKETPFSSWDAKKVTMLKAYSKRAKKEWEKIASSKIFLELGQGKLW
jgi:aminoglycoside 2'-N-acetyltransferase I